MIWKTEEGNPYTKLVECYGRLIDAAGEEWKDVCEARSILAVPLEGRSRHMEMFAEKRCRGNAGLRAAILAGLQKTVTREWQWRRDQKAAREGKAA